jgi:predicted DNA-binding transcriptional regulator AlpA
MSTTTEPELMTTKGVESEFGIPVGTLRYLRSCDLGPASFRLAGRVRYRRSEVLAWIAEQEQATRRGGVPHYA